MASICPSTDELKEALAGQPILDAHSHLDATHLCARSLEDVLLYHMVAGDLISAGWTRTARAKEPAANRIERAVAMLPRIENTSCFWMVRMIVEDLYGWAEPITAANWRKLDGLIRERSQDERWAREIIRRAGIRRYCTALDGRHDGRADWLLQYAMEKAFFAKGLPGEFDEALRELEKHAPSEGGEPIRSLDDVHQALDRYVQSMPFDLLISTPQHVSTDIDYCDPSEDSMRRGLARRGQASPAERDVYASYVLDAFLTRLERHPKRIVFQFSLGAERLAPGTTCRVSQRTLAQLGRIIARHPDLPFQCFLGSRHANQTLCTIARALPNFSLAGYWLHNFFPSAIRQVMCERLDMLSASRQIGFFSDAYCLEWSYAKARMVRGLLAVVLAEKVAAGQYDRYAALRIAHRILYEGPQELLGMEPMA